VGELEIPPAVASERAREQLRRRFGAEQYDEIRELWKRHSIAEEHRDLPGLIATLTEDCVYEIPAWRRRWEGHDGATRFYNELLTAFPDIHFSLMEIVIGPQGVCEEARVTATHQRDWLDVPASGSRLEFLVVIFFPWDEDRRLFQGERVHVSGLEAG
jgi:predicted ester cyclase